MSFLLKPLCLLFLLLISASCTAPEQNSIQNNEFSQPLHKWGTVSDRVITIWGDEADVSRVYIQRVLKRYQDLTNNKINIVTFTKQEMEKLFPVIFNSDDAKKPDILMSYGGSAIDRLNPAKNFHNFIDAPWIDDLTNTALDQAIYNGMVIGVPYGEASVSGMLYNKEIFQKYNIKVPKTQEEFLEVCKKLLGNGIIPVYLPYADISMLLYQFPMDYIFKDEELLTALNNGEISYTDIPEMYKIVEWYKTMATRGYFGEHYVPNNGKDISKAMISGKYAMVICWDTWLYTDFEGDPSKFGLMPAFIGVPENGIFEGANTLLALINKNGKNFDVSMDLVSFITDPYNYNVAFNNIYTAPMFNNQIGSMATPQYAENERIIDKLYHNSIAWRRIRGFSQLDAIYIQIYMKDKNYSAEQCLKDMDLARKKRLIID